MQSTRMPQAKANIPHTLVMAGPGKRILRCPHAITPKKTIPTIFWADWQWLSGHLTTCTRQANCVLLSHRMFRHLLKGGVRLN